LEEVYPTLTEICRCYSVNYILMAINQIFRIIPLELETLVNLTTLNMTQNLFNGTTPSYFGKFQMMQGLGLDGNRLSGQIPASIGNLTQVIKLFLSQNKLKGSIPSSFENCKNLQELDISQNNLSGSIPNIGLFFPITRTQLVTKLINRQLASGSRQFEESLSIGCL
jgi:Leucine-rich repeat (LRR) protein